MILPFSGSQKHDEYIIILIVVVMKIVIVVTVLVHNELRNGDSINSTSISIYIK